MEQVYSFRMPFRLPMCVRNVGRMRNRLNLAHSAIIVPLVGFLAGARLSGSCGAKVSASPEDQTSSGPGRAGRFGIPGRFCVGDTLPLPYLAVASLAVSRCVFWSRVFRALSVSRGVLRCLSETFGVFRRHSASLGAFRRLPAPRVVLKASFGDLGNRSPSRPGLIVS